MKINSLTHEFVTAIPEKVQEGTIYISLEYATAIHKCFCGCGHEVVTPISPTDWKVTFDGVSVSLSPSIGNWSFACQSHYWIDRNRVRWAAPMTKEQIAAVRMSDRRNKERQYGMNHSPPPCVQPVAAPDSGTIVARFFRWLKG